ncbi:MAG TPA: hypothetical protein VIY73_18380 [Polyangiaceae bacterium]
METRSLSLRIALPLAALQGLLVFLACGTSGGSGSSSFPYLGPSCTTSNTFYSDACWQCSQKNCSTGCETTDCQSYFACYCACTPGGPQANDSGLGNDNACQAACDAQIPAACTQCRSTLGACQAQSCLAACGSVDGGG